MKLNKFFANMIKKDMETRDSLNQKSSVMEAIDRDPSILLTSADNRQMPQSTKVVPRSNLEFLKKKINIQNIKNRERILKSVCNAYSTDRSFNKASVSPRTRNCSCNNSVYVAASHVSRNRKQKNQSFQLRNSINTDGRCLSPIDPFLLKSFEGSISISQNHEF